MSVNPRKPGTSLPAIIGGMTASLCLGAVALAAFHLVLRSVSDLTAVLAVCYGSLFTCMLLSAPAGVSIGVVLGKKRTGPALTAALLLCCLVLITVWHHFLDPADLNLLWALKQYPSLAISLGIMALAFAFFWTLLLAVQRHGKLKYQWH